MRVLILIVAGLGVAAALTTRGKPKEAEKPKVEKPADEVVALTKKVEHVVTGLQSIYDAQSKSADGPTRFALILKPFLANMNGVLEQVKTDKKLTEAQKIEKLKNAQASVAGLKKDMAKLSTDLNGEGEDEKDSLLLGVLMSRKNRPEAEQMEVLQSGEFKNLEVVKFVLAHRDAKQGLTEQVAAYLDKKHPPKPILDLPANASKAAATEMIVGALTGQLQKMQVHLADQERLHKKIMGEFGDAEHKSEAKMASLKDSKNQTQVELKKKASRAVKIAKRLEKKEDREYKKKHALLFHDISTIKTAIESVKKGDMKALEGAQKALMSSMQAMKASTGDFLHFLQLSDFTTERQGDCPYCKAQCLEKCHNDGHSFMDCMGTCANAGN